MRLLAAVVLSALLLTGCTGDPAPRRAAAGSPEADIARLFGPGFVARRGGAFGQTRIRTVPETTPAGRSAVRVTYPAGSASVTAAQEDGAAYGGAQVYLLLPHGPVDALRLRYCLRFPAGFDFVKGGKLPGLYGGTAVSGGHIPDGTNGWSTRYMWRRGGDGEVYAYLPSSRRHGTSLGRGAWRFEPGRWQCIEQEVRLNTPGRQDGSVTVRLDGHQVFAKKDVVFRTTGSLRIDGVFFSTFFGGGDASWATPRDQHVDFADLTVRPL